jgi:hypothetical protein
MKLPNFFQNLLLQNKFLAKNGWMGTLFRNNIRTFATSSTITQAEGQA